MAENDQKDKIVEKVTGEVENTDKKENNEDRYEKVCFICHRPESVTGKMIDLPNSPDDMMSRLSTMVLMGIKLPLEAVMRQIASGIDILVHLGRLRDKSRKVLEIMEVLGYEKGEIRLQPLFSFQETGSKDGKIQGEWVKRSTLTRTEKLMAAGYQPEGVCPGDNGKHSSGVSDRHAVLFKTMDDGSAFSSGNEVLRKDDPSGGGKREETF